MARAFHENGRAGSAVGLPALRSFLPSDSRATEKIGLVLRLLRQAALESRKSAGRPFYSIRAVARHYRLAPTTVTRLYGQLKTEGVLGSIWGSKTIIEPLKVDKDIRLKALIALPVSLRAFAIVPGYRRFFRLIQQTLWKHRFGSQLVFYDNGFPESPKFTDILLDYKVDIAIWLTPSPRVSNAVARLRDRGIRSITIHDGMPINGEPGYFASRQSALVEGLAGWKTAGIRSVALIHDQQSALAGTARMVQVALADASISFTSHEIGAAGLNGSLPKANWRDRGIIFMSSQSVVSSTDKGVAGLLNLSRGKRILFLEGEVDLPIERSLSGSFDTIEFDWRAVARRVVSDLVANRGAIGTPEQAIFKAKWRSATGRETVTP